MKLARIPTIRSRLALLVINSEALLHRADETMYKAKTGRKRQVAAGRAHEPEPAEIGVGEGN